MLEAHFKHTRSNKARQLLDQFDNIEKLAIKVIPKDYKLMMQKIDLKNVKWNVKMKQHWQRFMMTEKQLNKSYSQHLLFEGLSWANLKDL